MLAKHKLEEGCIFHSDRGSQYTSNAVMGLLKQYGLCQSFSRVGVPGDNAWVESFFATMKKELIHRTHYETKESVKAVGFEYIYILLLQCEEDSEKTRLCVTRGISQII
jgi:putative transposase